MRGVAGPPASAPTVSARAAESQGGSSTRSGAPPEAGINENNLGSQGGCSACTTGTPTHKAGVDSRSRVSLVLPGTMAAADSQGGCSTRSGAPPQAGVDSGAYMPDVLVVIRAKVDVLPDRSPPEAGAGKAFTRGNTWWGCWFRPVINARPPTVSAPGRAKVAVLHAPQARQRTKQE